MKRQWYLLTIVCKIDNKCYSNFTDDQSIQIDKAESDYYHFDKRHTGIRIHELWDYVNQHKGNQFEELFDEFKVFHGIIGKHNKIFCFDETCK